MQFITNSCQICGSIRSSSVSSLLVACFWFLFLGYVPKLKVHNQKHVNYHMPLECRPSSVMNSSLMGFIELEDENQSPQVNPRFCLPQWKQATQGDLQSGLHIFMMQTEHKVGCRRSKPDGLTLLNAASVRSDLDFLSIPVWMAVSELAVIALCKHRDSFLPLGKRWCLE